MPDENAVSWFRDFGDGYYSDLRSPLHYYEEFGKYEICLTVQNDCGSDTFCDTVRVKTAVAEAHGLRMDFYPNPARDHIKLILPWEGRYAITLATTLGQQFVDMDLAVEKPGELSLPLLGYSHGIYLVAIAIEQYVLK